MGDGWVWAIGAPLWAAALFYFVRSFKDWPGIMARWNERRRNIEEAKAGDWSRLRDEIKRLDERNAADVKRSDERFVRIEEREQECQRQLTDALHRIGELEGYNLGVGEAKQTGQRMLSEGRERDRHGRPAR